MNTVGTDQQLVLFARAIGKDRDDNRSFFGQSDAFSTRLDFRCHAGADGFEQQALQLAAMNQIDRAPARSPSAEKSMIAIAAPQDLTDRARSMTDPWLSAALSRPRRRSASIAFDQIDRPAATSAIAGPFSNTLTDTPMRCSATAAASPPMPPPTISARIGLRHFSSALRLIETDPSGGEFVLLALLGLMLGNLHPYIPGRA